MFFIKRYESGETESLDYVFVCLSYRHTIIAKFTDKMLQNIDFLIGISSILQLLKRRKMKKINTTSSSKTIAEKDQKKGTKFI